MYNYKRGRGERRGVRVKQQNEGMREEIRFQQPQHTLGNIGAISGDDLLREEPKAPDGSKPEEIKTPTTGRPSNSPRHLHFFRLK